MTTRPRHHDRKRGMRPASDTLVDAARKMRDLDVGALPICGEDDRLKGMITDRDIVGSASPTAVTRAVKVAELAEGKPVTIGADDSVEEALRTMTEHGDAVSPSSMATNWSAWSARPTSPRTSRGTGRRLVEAISSARASPLAPSTPPAQSATTSATSMIAASQVCLSTSSGWPSKCSSRVTVSCVHTTLTHTGPAGLPSLDSGPPTPVVETATSPPSRRIAPRAIRSAPARHHRPLIDAEDLELHRLVVGDDPTAYYTAASRPAPSRPAKLPLVSDWAVKIRTPSRFAAWPKCRAAGRPWRS